MFTRKIKVVNSSKNNMSVNYQIINKKKNEKLYENYKKS